jgi:hypothetical protein
LKVYKYEYSGLKYYGQGIREIEVRRALEHKLNLEIGTLPKGTSKIRPAELKRIVFSKSDLRYISSLTNIKITSLFKASIQNIQDKTNNDRQQVNSLLSKELNVDIEVLEKMDNSVKISEILKMSKDKILVKTHKRIKEKVSVRSSGEEGMEYTTKNVLVDTISRADELKTYIKRLFDKDYSLILDLKDPEMYAQKLTMSLSKSKKYINTPNHIHIAKLKGKKDAAQIITNEKRKHQERINTLPGEIRYYNNLIKMMYSKSYGTGYYVADKYLHNNHDEVREAFDECYKILKTRMQRNNLNYIQYNDTGFTIEEYLDSYMLFEEDNNKHVRVKT